MAEKKPARKSLKVTIYTLVIILAVFLHMLLDGVAMGSLFGQIVSEPTGIFQFIWSVLSWLAGTLFSGYGAILIGLIVAMEFIVMPLAQRYKYLTVKSNLLMSIIAAVYFMLVLRILAEAFL